MQKTGKYYWLTVTCYTTVTLGFIPILLFTGWISRSLWGIAGGMIICGFSNGIGGTSSLVALSKQKISLSLPKLSIISGRGLSLELS